MLKAILVFSIACSYLLLNEAKLSALEASEDYTHKLIVNDDDPNQYQLFWKLLSNDEIQFEIHCKTTGWVSMGISTNGGMAGADIAIGWVKDNKAYLKDCHAPSKSKPLIDDVQDWKLLDGTEVGSYTILKFKRKLLTCDENDKEIKIGSTFLIFAWNNLDPVTGNEDWQYHGKNRFSKVALLLDYKNEKLEDQRKLPSDVFTHDLRMNNLVIPPKETFYFCELFEFPDYNGDDAIYLVQLEMVVNKANKQNVHHLLAYECDANFEPPKLPFKQECGPVEYDPRVVAACAMNLFGGWAVGAPYNFTMPKDTGHKFTKNGKKRYLMLEMHYDNPTLEVGIIDDSGLRMHLTRQKVKHEVGMLLTGVDGSKLSLQIPPGTESIKFSGICYPLCTQKYIPKEGITVFAGILHTHLAGTRVTTNLVRNDTLLGPLFDDINYDFNYQYTQEIPPTKLYPGDALLTECTYSTKDRKKFTFWGHGTSEEMCFNFIYYYPKLKNFSQCISITPPKVQYDFYRSLMKDKLLAERVLNEDEFYSSMKEIATYVDSNIIVNNETIQKFKDFYSSEYDRSVFCGNLDVPTFVESVKQYKPKNVFEKDKCAVKSLSHKETLSVFTVVILTLCLIFFL